MSSGLIIGGVLPRLVRRDLLEGLASLTMA
jgi:hypothetical protein